MSHILPAQASTLIILEEVPLFQEFINRTKVGSLNETLTQDQLYGTLSS